MAPKLLLPLGIRVDQGVMLIKCYLILSRFSDLGPRDHMYCSVIQGLPFYLFIYLFGGSFNSLHGIQSAYSKPCCHGRKLNIQINYLDWKHLFTRSIWSLKFTRFALTATRILSLQLFVVFQIIFTIDQVILETLLPAKSQKVSSLEPV